MYEAPKAIVSLGDRCCGCGACAAACPKSCISMETDAWGFPRPNVDASECVDCGRCVSACPVLSSCHADKVCSVYWAKSKNDGELARSSSGGVFGLMASDVLASGGVVVGAAWKEDCHSVSHVVVDDASGLDAIMRSKYVQSTVPLGVYQGVRQAIKEGRRVLFSGTGCQVAGLRGYLGVYADSDLLLTVDVVCHGVPSPVLWDRWATYREASSGARLADVNMRSKTTGWLSYSATYEYEAEKGSSPKVESSVFRDDWYFKAFLYNACLRPSCFTCPAKRACGSDVTLGDFWGVQSAHPEVDYSGGVSAVICNTEKGEAALKAISNMLDSGKSTFEKVLAGNSSLISSVLPFVHYDEFMSDIAAGRGIPELMRDYAFRPSLFQRIRSLLSRVKRKFTKLTSSCKR